MRRCASGWLQRRAHDVLDFLPLDLRRLLARVGLDLSNRIVGPGEGVLLVAVAHRIHDEVAALQLLHRVDDGLLPREQPFAMEEAEQRPRVWLELRAEPVEHDPLEEQHRLFEQLVLLQCFQVRNYFLRALLMLKLFILFNPFIKFWLKKMRALLKLIR